MKQHRPSILAIVEPKKPTTHLESIADQLGFSHSYSGAPINYYIWIMWKDDVQMDSSIVCLKVSLCKFKDFFLEYSRLSMLRVIV